MEQQRTQKQNTVLENIRTKGCAQKCSHTEGVSSRCTDSSSLVELLPSARGNLPPA